LVGGHEGEIAVLRWTSAVQVCSRDILLVVLLRTRRTVVVVGVGHGASVGVAETGSINRMCCLGPSRDGR